MQLVGLVSGTTLVDRLGRRPLLICSCAVTTLGLFAMYGILGLHTSVHHDHGVGALNTTQGVVATHGRLLGYHGPAAAAETWVLLILMMTVEYAVGAGLNPVRIVLSAELMPNAYRPLGMSLGNACGWSLSLASLVLYPLASAAVGGPAPQFFFFGCVVASLTALLVWQLPETKGIDFRADG